MDKPKIKDVVIMSSTYRVAKYRGKIGFIVDAYPQEKVDKSWKGLIYDIQFPYSSTPYNDTNKDRFIQMGTAQKSEFTVLQSNDHE